jgi:hypothetical protein
MATKPTTKVCDQPYPILHGELVVARHRCSQPPGHKGTHRCWCGVVFTEHMVKEAAMSTAIIH